MCYTKVKERPLQEGVCFHTSAYWFYKGGLWGVCVHMLKWIFPRLTCTRPKKLHLWGHLLCAACSSAWISQPAVACGALTRAALFGAASGAPIREGPEPGCSPTSRPRSPCTRSTISWPTQTSPAPAWCRRRTLILARTDCIQRRTAGTSGRSGSSLLVNPEAEGRSRARGQQKQWELKWTVQGETGCLEQSQHV